MLDDNDDDDDHPTLFFSVKYYELPPMKIFGCLCVFVFRLFLSYRLRTKKERKKKSSTTTMTFIQS